MTRVIDGRYVELDGQTLRLKRTVSLAEAARALKKGATLAEIESWADPTLVFIELPVFSSKNRLRLIEEFLAQKSIDTTSRILTLWLSLDGGASLVLIQDDD